MSQNGNEVSDLDAKIIKQIEYYFGDVNLGRDKFLQEQQKLDQGWVPLETMLKFNRLKQLTEEEKMVVEALKKSQSGLIEINDEGSKIRRSLDKPLPVFSKQLAEDLKFRSIYAKGFPLESKLDEIMEFFEKYGPIDQVQMRKDFKKEFKGSCFVTYKSKEGAEKFLKDVEGKFKPEVEMIKSFKDEYFKKKTEEKKQQKNKKDQDKKQAEKESAKGKMVSGAILVMEGVAEGTKRDVVKKFLEEFGKVEWVDVYEENKKVKIRFSKENEAQEVKKKLLEKVEGGEEEDKKVKFQEADVTLKVLEGEEEVEHWTGILKSKAQHLSNKGNKNRGKKAERGKRKGGRGGGRGGPKNKKTKKGEDDDGPDVQDGDE